MGALRLSAIRLEAFKSFEAQTLPLEPLTLLVGRNGSGKSNALDGLTLLALLAEDRDVNDLERGDQEVAGLRGGLSGAAPFARGTVRIGCTVEREDGAELELSVELDARRFEINSEQLVLRRPGKRELSLIESLRQQPGAGISDVNVYSRGKPRLFHFLSGRLAVAQALTKVPEDSEGRQLVASCCRDVIAALRGVFLLDPSPAQMREYVRIGSPPNRTGSSLSAIAYRLQDDSEAWKRLNDLVRQLVETRLVDLEFFEGQLPDQPLADVMIALVEQVGTRRFPVSARLISDGTLRYLAIIASLLDLQGRQLEAGVAEPTTMVVEEIENGLFPHQAARVLDLLREEAGTSDVQLVATTHSPALLDALRPDDHRGVIVCDRSAGGRSALTRLVDHPRYVEIAGAGAVGRAATKGLLEPEPASPRRSVSELFAS